MKTPLVSITPSNYNWISESIVSILNQTFTDFEIIVINYFTSSSSKL